MAVVLNDISSDLEDPPRFFVEPPENPEFDLEKLKRPIQEAHEELCNLELPLSPAEAFGLARLLVFQRGWEVVGEDETVRRLQAVVTHPLLRSKSDVVIEVRPKSKGAIVAMRSKSRGSGAGSGANAKRIKKFFHDI